MLHPRFTASEFAAEHNIGVGAARYRLEKMARAGQVERHPGWDQATIGPGCAGIAQPPPYRTMRYSLVSEAACEPNA